jgi:hypothetical protein
LSASRLQSEHRYKGTWQVPWDPLPSLIQLLIIHFTAMKVCSRDFRGQFRVAASSKLPFRIIKMSYNDQSLAKPFHSMHL